MPGVFVSSNWLWGLDTFRWWPAPVTVALFALAAAGFVPKVARALQRGFERLGAAWEARPRAFDLLLGALVGAIVFALRDPVAFVGDLGLRLGALTLDIPMARLFPQAFPLDLALNVHLARALAASGLGPDAALQLVGALVAAGFTLAALAFLRAVGARGALLPPAALALLAGGYLVHFAGYDKYGPLLLGIALAAAGAARLLGDGRGAWTLAAGTAICLLSTRLGFAVLPASLLAFALAARRPARPRSLVPAAVACLAVAAAILPRTLAILLEFDRRVHMPGGAVARALESPGAPDLVIRLADAKNLMWFLVPLWPAGLAVLAGRLAAGVAALRPAGLGAVAALALATHLAILVGVRARQGVARDWDAYAGVALVVALAVVAALVSFWRRPGAAAATAPAAATVSLACALALWGLHANETAALARIEAQLEGRPAWSESARAAAHDYLGLRDLRLERFAAAARRFEAAAAIAPNPRFFYQAGLAHLGAGALEPAERAFADAVRRYRRIADPWVGLAQVRLARRDTLGAVTDLDSALARDPRHPEAIAIRRTLPGR